MPECSGDFVLTPQQCIPKMDHVSKTTPPLRVICHPFGQIDIVSLCTKFESSSFTIPEIWMGYPRFTSGSAIAEGSRDVLVSRNSATTKYRYRVALFAWSYVQPFLHNTEVWQIHPHRRTDRYTTTACTALSIASRGKNRPYCTAHQVQLPGNECRLIANF